MRVPVYKELSEPSRRSYIFPLTHTVLLSYGHRISLRCLSTQVLLHRNASFASYQKSLLKNRSKAYSIKNSMYYKSITAAALLGYGATAMAQQQCNPVPVLNNDNCKYKIASQSALHIAFSTSLLAPMTGTDPLMRRIIANALSFPFCSP